MPGGCPPPPLSFIPFFFIVSVAHTFSCRGRLNVKFAHNFIASLAHIRLIDWPRCTQLIGSHFTFTRAQLVVKKSETDPNVILNGRAALCAGRDDMSSEEDGDPDSHHRFRRPSNFQTMLESGAIPDAAMIHEARKKRQKARELGDFVAIDEPKADNKKGRLVREDAEDDGSDEERVDMSAITGAKEREERREKFYAAEHHGD